MDEAIFYLIEHLDSRQYVKVTRKGAVTLTTDPWDCLQFMDFEDAETYRVAEIEHSNRFEVVEHMFYENGKIHTETL